MSEIERGNMTAMPGNERPGTTRTASDRTKTPEAKRRALQRHLIEYGESLLRDKNMNRIEFLNAMRRENTLCGLKLVPDELTLLADELFDGASPKDDSLSQLEPPRSPHQFLVLPSSDDEEGWFPRGEISAIAGPSGGGKTRWLVELLEGM